MIKRKEKNYFRMLLANRMIVFVFLIFLVSLSLRFYNLEGYSFGYDQVNNAWAAMNIIVNGKMPLVGMVAKGNSGIYIGPLYYYMIAFFYWVTNLDPVASALFAGFTGIFSFISIFYVCRKLFSFQAAIIAVFIYTVSSASILSDRVQWPANFIPGISLLILYFLYRVVTGSPRYLLHTAIATGFSFSIHFTSVFYPILVLLSLPFFPKSRQTLKYILLSVPLFLVFLVPNLIAMAQGSAQSSHLTGYINTYYHGFHLRRVIQLIGDALIQFEGWFFHFGYLKNLKYIILPGFFILYLFRKSTRETKLLCYLIALWFLVPLLIFATYRGEISDYYFSINRYVALIAIAYIINAIFNIKFIAIKAVVVILLAYYAAVNLNVFFTQHERSLASVKVEVLEKIGRAEKIEFKEGDPASYLYYYFMHKKNPNEKVY